MIAFLEWFSFDGLTKWAKDIAVTLWDWFCGIVTTLVGPLWTPVSAAFAAVTNKLGEANDALAGIMPYLEFANAWAPVDVFFQCLIAYSAFWVALVAYRSVKKWIPTLSG